MSTLGSPSTTIALGSFLSPATLGGAAAADALPTAANVFAMVPLGEPASVGEPPIAPDLVSSISVTYPAATLRVASGQAVARATDTRARARFSLAWTHLTLAQRQTLRDWLINTVQHGRLAFNVRPDGTGSSAVRVRMVSAMSESMVDSGGTGQSDLPAIGTFPAGIAAPREAAVYSLSAEVEEVFS